MERAAASRRIAELVDDRIADGVFRVHGDAYRDPVIFEHELEHVFYKTWVFLGHVSQLPGPNSRLSAVIGRRPVLMTRNAAGDIRAFYNACRHKGAMLTRTETGSGKYLVCPYHGWASDSDGRNIDIKDRAAGGYSEAFGAEGHDLVPLPSLAVYKGLIFGACSEDVPPLQAFLGDMAVFLDLAMEQSPDGMEFVPGKLAFRYHGNWKLQLDNGTDFYHLTSTHAGFMDIMGRRRGGREGNQEARQFDWQKRLSQQGGTFQFPHGHAAVWLDQAEIEKRPIYPAIAEIRQRLGDVHAEWMLRIRGISVFPGMQIADGASLTLRYVRPLAVDLTEVRYFCLAPVGEAPEVRAWRLRQFEDFFNVSGLATPDDAVLYEDCQRGFNAATWMQGYARGLAHLTPGGNPAADRLGVRPLASVSGGFEMQNETTLHPLYREWARLLAAGLEGRPAYG